MNITNIIQILIFFNDTNKITFLWSNLLKGIIGRRKRHPKTVSFFFFFVKKKEENANPKRLIFFVYSINRRKST